MTQSTVCRFNLCINSTRCCKLVLNNPWGLRLQLLRNTLNALDRDVKAATRAAPIHRFSHRTGLCRNIDYIFHIKTYNNSPKGIRTFYEQ